MGGLLKQAWNEAATIGNAVKGFEKTGISPISANAISDFKFIGDQELDIVESQVQCTSTQQVQPSSIEHVQPQIQVQVQSLNTQSVQNAVP